jgi:UDP-glucose 4-epimerase
MHKAILVTGGRGFLGRAVARAFRQQGFRVVGFGHGDWTVDEALAHGFDAWHAGDVTLSTLSTLNERFDVIAHCAAASSVTFSLEQPLQAFRMTVQCTAELLEHVRRAGSTPLVLYPSSAAVYGAADDRPLKESDRPNPVSPYGTYKQMAEELLASYARHSGVRSVVIRYFSIYGSGLAKQLLWDAAAKLSSGQPVAEFWGTGEETRDWIHVDDAAALMLAASTVRDQHVVVNGASGDRVTVADVLGQLRDALGVDVALRFNGIVKPGDPRYYHADVSRMHALGWRPSVRLHDGLRDYVRWLRRQDVAAAGGVQ